MSEAEILVGLTTIVVGGVAAQWLARVLRVPSVLLLLAAGFIAGSATGLVEPDELFGELLFPGVSLAVGLLLFDGGMELDLRRIANWRGVVVRLVTVGVLVTWVIGSLVVDAVTDLDGRTAWLAGAILVVSGPTVVLPILDRVKPSAPSGEILEWEGIVIDPIGALLGTLMLNVVVGGAGATSTGATLAATIFVGIGVGFAAAFLTVQVLRLPVTSRAIAAPVALAIAMGAFTIANVITPEGGLFATTMMGVILANQRMIDLRDIEMFEDGVGILALGSLFVVLGARVSPSELSAVVVPGVIVLAALALIARPLAVWLSTVGAGLDRSSRLFMVALAPRGIVAAATSAAFAIELEMEGYAEEAAILAPLTFVVIIAAGILYGLGAGPVAKRLGVSQAGKAETDG